jgi:hypothetical protein
MLYALQINLINLLESSLHAGLELLDRIDVANKISFKASFCSNNI